MLPFSEAPPDINSLYIEHINHTQLNTFIIQLIICLTLCLCVLFLVLWKSSLLPSRFRGLSSMATRNWRENREP